MGAREVPVLLITSFDEPAASQASSVTVNCPAQESAGRAVKATGWEASSARLTLVTATSVMTLSVLPESGSPIE